MPMTSLSPASKPLNWARALRCAVLVLAAWQLAGCATLPSPPPTERTPLAQDAARLTDEVLGQWRRESPLLAAFARLRPYELMLAPLADPITGEQTPSLLEVRRRMAARVDAAFPEFQRTTAGAAPQEPRFLLHMGLEPQTSFSGEVRVVGKDPVVTLTLVDLSSRMVVARASGRVRDALADKAPIAFFRDSPVILPPVVDLVGPVPAGLPVPAQVLVDLPAQGLIDLAQAAYDGGDYTQALALFARAEALPGGRQQRVFNGQYLAYTKLARSAEAQRAFISLVNLGLQSKSLALNFLFQPNSTDFWPDPAVSGPYDGWIAEIAQQSVVSGVCLTVRGHSSRSGDLEYNHDLSLHRAQRIRDRLVELQAPLAERLQIIGLGWSENIVGTGADDASDAVDRRVEFRVSPCPQAPV
jgi:outer membrane protein OmpA-like peptidoglycan-associated protein